MVITTKIPPMPVPLTVAGVATVFVPKGLEPRPLVGSSPCVGPRVPDPCPGISWPGWCQLRRSQMVTVIEALRTLANVRRVIFLQIMTVVELVHGDGQEYSVPSLPGIVAEVTTTYHHSPLPVFEHLKDLSQDGTNHLEEPSPCQQYSNEMYFQADLQKRLLVEADTLQPNSYFQVDGMSTGLITFIISGDRHGRTYPSASQQAKISAVNWQRHLVYRICGVLSSDLVEKLHGAAIVGVENGDVAEILETRQSATMHNARRWTIWLRRGGR